MPYEGGFCLESAIASMKKTCRVLKNLFFPERVYEIVHVRKKIAVHQYHSVYSLTVNAKA